MSAYDSLILGILHFRQLGATITEYNAKNLNSIEEFTGAFEQSNRLKAAQDLLMMTNSNTRPLQIHPSMSSAVNLSNTWPFLLSDGYGEGPEFVMSSSLHYGRSLNQTLEKFRMKTPFGPNTVKILEGIGFANPVNAIYPRMTIDWDFGTIRYNPGSTSIRRDVYFM